MTESATLQYSSLPTAGRNLRYVRWLRPFQIDVRALAVMRIMLGITVLYDVMSRIGLLRWFYTDDGASPRSVFLGGSLKWQSFYSLSGTYGWAVLLLTIHGILALLFTIGFRTRLVTIALFAMMWSLINRNPTLSHGGNHLVAWMLIWSLFVPVNAVASVDAYTARPRPRFRRVASIATAAMLIQIAFVYWLAFAAKTSADWRSDFSAVYYFLNSHLSTPLGYAIGQLPALSQLLTIGSLGLELFGPFFALLTYSMPRTRTLIVLGFILFHLGLVATMYVGTFSFICIAAWMIYIPTPM
ncbi:MAG: HTTM domain-containing protein, partial [Anaerolineae bacterium]|nr:HTTM domain-containing protein [Phycisphaerae bacterium]